MFAILLGFRKTVAQINETNLREQEVASSIECTPPAHPFATSTSFVLFRVRKFQPRHTLLLSHFVYFAASDFIQRRASNKKSSDRH